MNNIKIAVGGHITVEEWYTKNGLYVYQDGELIGIMMPSDILKATRRTEDDTA